ncbi:CAP-Gly domain protein [Consotaella salsifontis]|uniref:CAP-Gly domain-containing protein n=1 Tax=Consotaella salsifontis TaxID=1365950 RepID=A0A1T4SRS0_9HYPH|nr:CAP-Gly domain protein [Consotaella salsifontis]SKA30877.1 hypothetical protein SAMN05428963_11379 [Consotaella salsifontis]
MNHFHVGQEVVCIDDKFNHVSIDQGIRKGAVYTIRWLGMYRHYIDGEFLGVKLAGIDRGVDPGGYGADDMPFAARRFRPLVRDPLASLRNIAADPDGYVPPAPEELKRKVKEEETVG